MAAENGTLRLYEVFSLGLLLLWDPCPGLLSPPVAPKDNRSRSLEPVNVKLYGNRVFADVIKDVEMGRYSWVIQVAQCYHQEPDKREAVGHLTLTEEKPRKDGGRD